MRKPKEKKAVHSLPQMQVVVLSFFLSFASVDHQPFKKTQLYNVIQRAEIFLFFWSIRFLSG